MFWKELLRGDAPAALALARPRDRLPISAAFYFGKWRVEVERAPRPFRRRERVRVEESCEGLFYSYRDTREIRFK